MSGLRGEVYRIGTHQKVSYTGTAGTSAEVGDYTNVVRVICTTAAYIAIDATATAAAGIYMPANKPEYFVVTPGQTISAIQVASGGNLHVTEMTA